MKKLNYTLLSILLLSVGANAQNPIIGDIGISDPHVRVFNDTVYLYSGHDSDPHDKTFVMPDWRVFSTNDLVNWKLRSIITPKENYMDDNSVDCHAGDAQSRDGKYYFYFSDESRGIGVMTSKSPAGPFIDALGKPLIAPLNDPTILVDDDKSKTPYIIWGNKSVGGFQIAKLNENMISLAEVPKIIKIGGSAWERAPKWQDKNYLFKYKDTYYLSWGAQYATSKNVYGPYECVGSVGRGYKLGGLAHGSFFWWKGQFYHMWCYYKDINYKFRETVITYCHLTDDGKVVTDTKFLDEHFSNGVGQYNAGWPKIEAEWFYEISGGIEKRSDTTSGRIVLNNIQHNNWVRFANMTFDEEKSRAILNILSDKKGGKLEVRIDAPTGKVIGEIKLPKSKVTDDFRDFECTIDEFQGGKDIYLIFKGDKKAKISLDWLKFKK